MSHAIEIDLCGGLGDSFIMLHESSGYDRLETLLSDERASIRIISHNPFVREIFDWHPKREQIDVSVARYFFLDYFNPSVRRDAGIPENPPRPLPARQRAPIRFYPSPQDLDVLREKLPRGEYLAVAPTASGLEVENRDLPPEILNVAIGAAQTAGVPIVLLGRTYQGPHAPKDRHERPSGPGIVDLTDRLSVPGTAFVVKRAAGILSAHSSLLLLSWYERKPVFALYPPKYEWHDFTNPSPFGFGKDYPETFRMTFSRFSRKPFVEFLDINFRGSP